MGFISEFRTFLMRGNVVDLAVGVVIGSAFAKIVDAVVNGLFMPIIGLLTGGIDFSGYRLKLYGDASLGVGLVIQAIFTFVIVGWCLFLVVKGMNRLQKKEVEKPDPLTRTESLLTDILAELKKQSSGS